MANSQHPALSVVVIVVSDTTRSSADVSHLAGTLEALAGQIDPPAMEIIVPHHPKVEGIAMLARRFPEVRFLAVNDLKTFTGQGGAREHHDELRARGLAAARGEIIALTEDHGRPGPHWAARLIDAHRQSYAGIGGAIENGIDKPLNWSVYFCDFGKYQNPAPAGECSTISDANASYKRPALESIRAVWQHAFVETAVNPALISRGEKLALAPDAILYQHRLNLRLGGALKERYVWGRSFAASRRQWAGPAGRFIYAALSPLLPAVLLLRMTANVMRKRRCRSPFLKALPLTAALAAAWASGEFAGYCTGRATRPIRAGAGAEGA